MNVAGTQEYALALEARMARGAAHLPQSFLETQRAYLARAMDETGWFAGRRGEADLYYTAFGLRAARLVGLADERWSSLAAEWTSWSGTVDDIVQCNCLVVIARMCGVQAPRLVEAVEAHLAVGSRHHHDIYSSFLTMVTLGLLGIDHPAISTVVGAIRECRRSDAGYADESLDVSGLNTTAAAVAVLVAAGAMAEEERQATGDFLAALQRPDGGLASHALATEADLLSTFTGLVAAHDLGCLGKLRLGDLARYVYARAVDGGGFLATGNDGLVDVEYTFYGLASLALLAELVAERG